MEELDLAAVIWSLNIILALAIVWWCKKKNKEYLDKWKK
jgi:hypothetical protein|tara:strand:- start:2285 stop:2401 length:117 start_codon:yes stop_codon:yes gene_type:complete